MSVRFRAMNGTVLWREPLEPFPDLSAAIRTAAHRLSAEHDLNSMLQSIVDAAAASLPGISHAGISLAHRGGRFETLAATDPLVRELDALQHALGEGPCVYAVETEQVVTVNHLRDDQRWPLFAARAAALGLRSQMGLVLHTDDHRRGGLNLYSTETDVIDPDVQHLAELFAAHAALALGFVRQNEELHSVLASRKTVGQAMGIVMERYGVDEDRAFGYLRRVSSNTNVKLRDIAAGVVDNANRIELLPRADETAAHMRPTPAQSVRDAIELMTAWSARPDGPPDLLIESLHTHLDNRPPERALVAATELIMGMTTLCGAVLALNEEATGLDMHATLRELALYYAED